MNKPDNNPQKPAPEQAAKKLVLVIEDNKLNLKLFNDLLEFHGYRTVTTATGVGAVELVRQHKPDLILLDVQLPGISGLEISKTIKQDSALKHIPIIAVTAFAMKGDEEKIRESGCDDYISKPINVRAFIQKMETYLPTGKK